VRGVAINGALRNLDFGQASDVVIGSALSVGNLIGSNIFDSSCRSFLLYIAVMPWFG
jgi:hypothetical protein